MSDRLLAEHAGLPPESRTREWLTACEELKATLGRDLAPKRLGSGALDGPSLAELLTRAVNLLADPSTLPADPHAILGRGLLAAQAERARNLAVAAYSLAVSEELPEQGRLPYGRRAIDTVHRCAKLASLRVFMDVAPFGSRGGNGGGGGDQEEGAILEAARGLSDWAPARDELKRLRALLIQRDAKAATARCEALLAATGDGLSRLLQPADEAQDGGMSSVCEAAVEDAEARIRPLLERLVLAASAPSSAAAASPEALTPGGGKGKGASVIAADGGMVKAGASKAAADSEWEVNWNTVGYSLPLLLRRAAHGAAILGAKRSHKVTTDAQREVIRLQNLASESLSTCAELTSRLKAHECREDLLLKELKTLEDMHASWNDPDGLLKGMHLETERSKREGRAAAARLESCERELDALQRRFDSPMSTPMKGGGSADDAPASRLGARSAEDLPKGRSVLSAGLNFSLAVGADGRLYSWGCGSKGQLGAVSLPQRSTLARSIENRSWTPSSAQPPVRSKLLAASPPTYTEVLEESQLHEGRNGGGGGGNGMMQRGSLDAPTPKEIEITGVREVTMIAAASEHALCVDGTGAVWGWGSGKNGELGSGHVGLSGTPKVLKTLSAKKIVCIAAGGRHCGAVATSGELYTWGDGRSGQLGHGDTASRQTPLAVASLHGRHLSSVACGLEHTIVVSAGGGAFAFGSARHGRLGIGDAAQQVPHGRQAKPKLIGSKGSEQLSKILTLACGDAHTLLLTNDGNGINGKLLSCGHGAKGALGLGHPMDGWTPQPVQCLDGVALKQLAAGSDFSLVLGSKGDVYAFGGNAYGQLGLGHNEAPVLLPQLIGSLTSHTIVAIAAGTSHALALGRSGALFSWGRGASYQLGHGEPPMSIPAPRLVSALMHTHADDGGYSAATAAGSPRAPWHESRDRLAWNLERLQQQTADHRGVSEEMEIRMSTLKSEVERLERCAGRPKRRLLKRRRMRRTGGRRPI